MRKSIILLLTGVLFITACSKTNSGTTPVIPITTPKNVVTLAGSGLPGKADGLKEMASFNHPSGIAIDGTGFLYIADKENSRIRQVSPQGVVITIAGSGRNGGANGKDTSASFNFPNGLAADAASNVFIADQGNSVIRKLVPGDLVSTLAGSGLTGKDNGAATAASFNGPAAVAIDANGNVFVADAGNNLIREISTAGAVTTFAGSGAQGSINGAGTAASFNNPAGLAIDAGGNVYVADAGNNLIRKITPSGVVTTFAGSGAIGSANGSGTAASFNAPAGVTVDAAGNVYVADTGNNLIRKINPAGLVTTFAGSGAQGKDDGSLTAASFNAPGSVAVDISGNVYVADTGNNLIRRITPSK
jgi:sugar lactone lactonase YvrE